MVFFIAIRLIPFFHITFTYLDRAKKWKKKLAQNIRAMVLI